MRGRVEWVGGGEGLGREGGRTISWRGRRWVLVAGGCCMVWWGIDEVGERERGGGCGEEGDGGEGGGEGGGDGGAEGGAGGSGEEGRGIRLCCSCPLVGVVVGEEEGSRLAPLIIATMASSRGADGGEGREGCGAARGWSGGGGGGGGCCCTGSRFGALTGAAVVAAGQPARSGAAAIGSSDVGALGAAAARRDRRREDLEGLAPAAAAAAGASGGCGCGFWAGTRRAARLLATPRR